MRFFTGGEKDSKALRVTPNVHNEGRARLLRASLSIVGLGGSDHGFDA